MIERRGTTSLSWTLLAASTAGLWLILRFYLGWSYAVTFLTSSVFALVSGIGIIIVAGWWSKQRRFEVASSFGKVDVHDSKSLYFARDSASFHWQAELGGHSVTFECRVPGRKFVIISYGWSDTPENLPAFVQATFGGSGFDAGAFADCKPVSVPDLSKELRFISNSPEFLLGFISVPPVRETLVKYIFEKVRFTFDGINCKLEWQTGSNENLEDFRQICITATVLQQALAATRA